MTDRTKAIGSRILKYGVSWAVIKLAFFIGAIAGMIYVGGLIYAVNYYGADATVQKVSTMTGGRI